MKIHLNFITNFPRLTPPKRFTLTENVFARFLDTLGAHFGAEFHSENHPKQATLAEPDVADTTFRAEILHHRASLLSGLCDSNSKRSSLNSRVQRYVSPSSSEVGVHPVYWWVQPSAQLVWGEKLVFGCGQGGGWFWFLSFGPRVGWYLFFARLTTKLTNLLRDAGLWERSGT